MSIRSSESTRASNPVGRSLAPTVLFCVGTFFFWASLYVYMPVLSVHARSVGASLTLVGLVVSMYGATQLLVRIPIGFFSDRAGRRKPFILAGLLAAGVGCLGLALSPSPWFLVGSRAVIGLGAATWVAFSVFFAGYFALHNAARAMSIIMFVSGAAQALSGLAGGYLSERLGAPATFYAGVALAAVGLVAMLPIREVVHPRPAEMSLARLASIARTPALLVAAGVATVNVFAMFSTTLSFTPVYARGLGASDSELGMLTTVTTVAYTVATLLGASVAGRMGDRWIVFLGMSAAGVAAGIVPLTGDLLVLTATQVVAGFGRGICYPTLMSLSIRLLPSHERASGMGVFQAVYSFGMFLGPALGGVAADALGLGSVFILTAVLCLAAAAWGLFSKALGRQAHSTAVVKEY